MSGNEAAIDNAKRSKWLDHLRHMLGATVERKQRDHGCRNYFCAGIGHSDHNTMLEMEKAGLVKAAGKINQGRDQYFHATMEGCKAIKLSKAATKRAFERFKD